MAKPYPRPHFRYPLWVLLRSVPETHMGSKFAYLELGEPLGEASLATRPKYMWALEIIRRFVRRHDVLAAHAHTLYREAFRRCGTSDEKATDLEYLLPAQHNAAGYLHLDGSARFGVAADVYLHPGIYPDECKQDRLRRAKANRERVMKKKTFNSAPPEMQRTLILISELKGLL